MKILSISDIIEPSLHDRFEAEQFANVDLILSCGDLSTEYLSLLAESLHAPLLYVCGNHDIRFGSKTPYGCTNINARIVKIQGYTILGLEGSRWYNGGRYQYTNMQMWKTVLFLLPKIWRHGGIDIIITHAPPRLKIDTKKDHHVVDKLFSLEEIKDVHLVIGNVDIIAKIILQRDLLSSDAVTIGEFIQNQVRRIPGIVSTETLIPGYSKTKP